MKKQPGLYSLMADIATLLAVAENMRISEELELEDPQVWKRPVIMRNKAGEEKTYYRWYCSWFDGRKTVKAYLGSCTKMSEEQAVEKAKRLKAESLRDAKEGV